MGNCKVNRVVTKVQQPMPLEPFAKHDRSHFIQPGKTANGLAQINAQNLDVHQMLLSPPLPAMIATFGGKAVHPIRSVGLAASPDSDDTETHIRATLSNLRHWAD